MKPEVEDVRRQLAGINRKFSSGVMVNKGSLDFALSSVFRGKDWQERLAFVVRALICDRVFEDGNKRTAAAYMMGVLEHLKYRYDPFRIDQLVLKMAKNNVSDLKKIRRMIENASARNL